MSEKEETYIEHLADLRKRFIKVLIFFIIVLIITFMFVPQIIDFITLTSKSVDLDLNAFNITDPLALYIKVASIIAFIVSFPYLLLQLWLFISPGLKKHEKRFVYKYIPLIFILFILGIAFSYFIIVPYYVMFSQRLAGNTDLNILVGANKYIEFIGRMVLLFGLIFQFPILVYILSYINIISSKLLINIRKYAYFALLIASAFITPPDPVSMGIALLPLALLYEISILLSKLNERKKKKKKEEFE